MPVGDVHSTARGSGARYNDGKPDLSLIPVEMIANTMPGSSDLEVEVSNALVWMGRFQVTGKAGNLNSALLILRPYWRDCARVFEYGRAKYAAWNWAKGMAWSIPLACAARHALAILEGEEIDAESGHPHVGHFMANLVMLRHFVDTFPEGNDLPPPELFATAPAAEQAFNSPPNLPPLFLVDPSGKHPPEVVQTFADMTRCSCPTSRHSLEGFEEVLSNSVSEEDR